MAQGIDKASWRSGYAADCKSRTTANDFSALGANPPADIAKTDRERSNGLTDRDELVREWRESILSRERVKTGQPMRASEIEHAMTVGDRMADRIEADGKLIAEMRRLISAWQFSSCPDCSGDCASANPPVAYCVMRETSAILARLDAEAQR
jgi:hypothetical protein